MVRIDVSHPSDPGSTPGSGIFNFFLQMETIFNSLCMYYFKIPVSLGGQDTWFSPTRPGFNSRTGNFLVVFLLLKALQTVNSFIIVALGD